MLTALPRLHLTYDADLVLKDAGLVAASAAAQVASANKILDLAANGLGNGADGSSLKPEILAFLVIDVSAVEIADNNELFTVSLQGCNTSDFSTGSPAIEDLAIIQFGAHEVLGGNVDSVVGRYVIPITNVKLGTAYRYLRLYTTVAGTVGTGINYTARLAS